MEDSQEMHFKIHRLYIDDNVSSLMVVPAVIRGSEFSIE